MKILHALESYLPKVHGMSEVVRQLSERMVELGHDVTVVTSTDAARKDKVIRGVKIVEFEISGNAVWGMWGEKTAYQDFLQEGGYDIVTFFAAHQWATDLALPILNKIPGKKIFVPTGFSGFYQAAFQPYFQGLKTQMVQFDHSIFLSHDYRDINFARELGITALSVIPNGADEREFKDLSAKGFRKDHGIEEDEVLMITVGSHTGKKGHAEAIKILNSLKTPRKITLLIIGNLPTSGSTHRVLHFVKSVVKRLINYQGGGDCVKACLRAERIQKRKSNLRRLLVRSFQRSETLKAYAAADLFLFPSNIECSPVVLFEANAAGIPFFVTDVGNSAEIASWTRGGEVLPTVFDKDRLSHALVDDSVRLLDKWIDDPKALMEMGMRGQAEWKSHYTWQSITLEYLQLYQKLTGAQ